AKAAQNSWDQLVAFGVWAFDRSDWVSEAFNTSLAPAKASYLRSKQSRNALPLEFFSRVVLWTVVASLAVIVVFAILAWRQGLTRALGLSAVVISIVLANAFVTGALSGVEDRYESRVIWLVPLLAAILVLSLLEHRLAEASVPTPTL